MNVTVARGQLKVYLALLRHIDASLVDILSALPNSFRRELESEAFRSRANNRFAELSFMGLKALGPDELVPQAVELVGGEVWFPAFDSSVHEISEGYCSIFGDEKSGSMQKVSFQRLLAAHVVIAFLRRIGAFSNVNTFLLIRSLECFPLHYWPQASANTGPLLTSRTSLTFLKKLLLNASDR